MEKTKKMISRSLRDRKHLQTKTLMQPNGHWADTSAYRESSFRATGASVWSVSYGPRHTSAEGNQYPVTQATASLRETGRDKIPSPDKTRRCCLLSKRKSYEERELQLADVQVFIPVAIYTRPLRMECNKELHADCYSRLLDGFYDEKRSLCRSSGSGAGRR